jgi:putative membrane protein
MDPILRALLLSWDWRAEVIAVLVVAGTIYTVGWRRLRHLHQARHPKHSQQASPRRLASGRRLAAYLGGLGIIGLALMSPIDVLGGQLFFMHMIQHLLLVMLAPPLLLIASPFPFFLWGLPPTVRGQVARLFKPGATFRHLLRLLTRPGLVWLVFIAIFLGWHDPNAYNAALTSDRVHDLEHITFFGTALLFWWHVIGVGPRIHGRFPAGVRVAYVLITVPVNMLAGVAITFSTQPIYTYYTTVPRLWGITVMQDQMLGGIIMWIPGSMMYIMAALVLIAKMVQTEADKQPLPESEWATDEAMVAPGWEK